MDADAQRKKRPIAKLLDAANLDLDAAKRLLADPANVLAANHLQQAAEKILSAVRLDRGLLNTKDHDLIILIDGRPVVSLAHSRRATLGAAGCDRWSGYRRTPPRFGTASPRRPRSRIYAAS